GADRRRARHRDRDDEPADVLRGVHQRPHGDGRGHRDDHLRDQRPADAGLCSAAPNGTVLLMATTSIPLGRRTPASRQAARIRLRPSKAAISAVMLLVAIPSLLPFVWAFLTSLKVERQVYAFPPQILPNPVTSYNYFQAINHGLLLALFNSLFVSSVTV